MSEVRPGARSAPHVRCTRVTLRTGGRGAIGLQAEFRYEIPVRLLLPA
jgi:hypothetical protein